MSRVLLVLTAVALCFLLGTTLGLSQASGQLEGRAKSVATPQQDSWKQVDEINKETDGTKSRYQQAQQSGAHAATKSGYSVKKTTAGSRYAFKKPSPPKSKRPLKKK